MCWLVWVLFHCPYLMLSPSNANSLTQDHFHFGWLFSISHSFNTVATFGLAIVLSLLINWLNGEFGYLRPVTHYSPFTEGGSLRTIQPQGATFSVPSFGCKASPLVSLTLHCKQRNLTIWLAARFSWLFPISYTISTVATFKLAIVLSLPINYSNGEFVSCRCWPMAHYTPFTEGGSLRIIGPWVGTFSVPSLVCEASPPVSLAFRRKELETLPFGWLPSIFVAPRPLTTLGRRCGRTGFTEAMAAAWAVSIFCSSLPICSTAAFAFAAFAACSSARLSSSARFSAGVLLLDGALGSPRHFVALDMCILRGEGFAILEVSIIVLMKGEIDKGMVLVENTSIQCCRLQYIVSLIQLE